MEILKLANNLFKYGAKVCSWFKKFARRKNVKKVRKNVDSHDVDGVRGVMLKLLQRRKSRRDSS